MLKISYESHSSPTDVVLRLEGQVAGRWVAELRRVYDERRSGAAALTIDLKNVTFIDRESLALFDEIYPDVTLVNCSLFAAEQLKPVIERHDAV